MNINPKPGPKSSEFWAVVIYAVVLVLNGTEYVEIAADQMTVFAGLVGSYVLGRSWVKGETAKSVVAAALKGEK